MKCKLGLAQMEFRFGDPDENLSRVGDRVQRARAAEVDIVLFPELWASGYDLEHSTDHAAPLGEGMFESVSELAREHELVIGGSLLEMDGGDIYNTFTLYDGEGTLLAHYRKIHLFRLLDEEKWLTAGDEIVQVDTRWGSIGLSTCYDLRFPEMYRAYALAGVKLILIVAEWPQSRIDHWWKLLQARAIENQVYVAAVNKVGYSQGAKLGGQSAVIDPWGEVMVRGDRDESLLTATIDLDEVEKTRRAIPVFKDRNPDAYRQLREKG